MPASKMVQSPSPVTYSLCGPHPCRTGMTCVVEMMCETPKASPQRGISYHLRSLSHPLPAAGSHSPCFEEEPQRSVHSATCCVQRGLCPVPRTSIRPARPSSCTCWFPSTSTDAVTTLDGAQRPPQLSQPHLLLLCSSAPW